MIESVLSQLALIAGLVERGIQLLKPLYQVRFEKYQMHIDILLAWAGNVFLCVTWHVNLFDAVGFSFSPVAGEIGTGIAASLGSVILHELIEILVAFRKGLPQVSRG